MHQPATSPTVPHHLLTHQMIFKATITTPFKVVLYLLPVKNYPVITNKLRYPKTLQSLTVKAEQFRKRLYHIVDITSNNVVKLLRNADCTGYKIYSLTFSRFTS